MLKYIFVNKNHCILVQIFTKFVPIGAMDKKSSLIQLTAQHWIDDKPLSETMMTLLCDTHASPGHNVLNLILNMCHITRAENTVCQCCPVNWNIYHPMLSLLLLIWLKKHYYIFAFYIIPSHLNHADSLTLNVRGPSYLGLTRSISWLLMPWLLTSPGHQQPWYWLCRICKSWSYLRKDFKYLCHINVE